MRRTRPNRRRFLLSAAAVPLCLGATRAWAKELNVKIDHIDVFPLRYPMTGHFKFFTGPHGSLGRAAVIVKITADNGVVGWGQSVPLAKWSYETLETSTIAIRIARVATPGGYSMRAADADPFYDPLDDLATDWSAAADDEESLIWRE